ncbi:hypothetical protein PIB30_008335 [Stylosanthes scabra]|uniref:F-box domain-containing protein n=1 Tax=Stylosanthes scabra TaxID=79078 RepID=A0ABU6T6W4_9FABA|nr:hypothetical protein [Stylosanthes scabra]
MSDIPPSGVFMPKLPDDLLFRIFIHCDAKTLIRVQATNHFWMESLSTQEFVAEIENCWRKRGCSLFGHFGHNDESRRSSDWIIKMSSHTGQRFPATLPFLMTQQGWFDVVGIDKGVFYMRYSSVGVVSNLVAWNPISRRKFVISDHIHEIGDETSFLLAFLYFPKTVNYAVVSIYLELGDNPRTVFTLFNSSVRSWSPPLECPPYVRRLDPQYVTVNRIVFWATWSHSNETEFPPYIVSFSPLTAEFQQLPLPGEALTTCHTLLNRDGHLCIAINDHNFQAYNSVIWQPDVVNEEIVWTKLFEVGGNGPSFIPAVMVENDVIHVLERHVEVNDEEGVEFTHIHLRRFYSGCGRRTLLWANYEGDVKLRSVNTFYESFYPV